MKKRINRLLIKKVISLLVVAALALPNYSGNSKVYAADTEFTENGLQYKVLSETDNTVTVTGTVSKDDVTIDIPNAVTNGGKEYTIVRISSNAFKDCTSLKNISFSENIETIENEAFLNDCNISKIDLPKKLKTLGYGAFGNCIGLTSVTIPKSLESSTSHYNNSKNGAFRECKKLKEVTFEENITAIAPRLFANCDGLSSINIPNTVKVIGGSAFENCKNIQSIDIPDSVTEIGDSAFENAINLQKVDFGKNVETIGNSAFYGCECLSVVNFSESITTIGNQAFYSNIALEQLKLPGNIKKLGYSSFGKCQGLTEIKIPKSLEEVENFHDDSRDGAFCGCLNLEKFEFEEGTTLIASRLCANCSGLKSITIPNTVEEIGVSAFSGCSNLLEMDIPGNVKKVGDYAFLNATALKKVVFGDGVTAIGNNAFSGCDHLSDVQFSDTITEIGNLAFDGNTALKNLILPANIKTLGYSAFRNCSGLTQIKIPKSLETVTSFYDATRNGAFCDCINLRNVEFEEGVTRIAPRLFANCNGLKEITIPDGVTFIGNRAFFGCTSLETVDMTESVLSVEAMAFSGCERLRTINLSDNITEIGYEAFFNDGMLSDVVLPKNIKIIGYGAYANCVSLTKIVLPKSLEQTTKANSQSQCGVFRGCINLSDIEFEEGTTVIASYLFANFQSADKVVIPETVTTIGTGAFMASNTTESVVIPDSVVTIEKSAFEEAVNIKKLVIGKNVESIGDFAFNNCGKIATIQLSDSITQIGKEAFNNDKDLSALELPKNIQTIGYGAFGSCEKLTSIFIPKSLEKTTISTSKTANGVFRGCTNLKDIEFEEGTTIIASALFANCEGIRSIQIPNTVTSINESAFYGCKNLASVEIPDSVTKIGKYAFENCEKLGSVNCLNVQTIGGSAFKNATALENVNLGYHVTEVKDDSFTASSLLQLNVPKYSSSALAFIDAEYSIKFSDTSNDYSKNGIIKIDKSSYDISTSNLDTILSLNLNYEIKQEEFNNAKNLKLVIKLPKDAILKSIKQDDEYLPNTQYKVSSKNVITINVSESSGKFTLYTDTDATGEHMNSYAVLQYTKDSQTKTDIIGVVSDSFLKLSLDNLDEVSFEPNAENAFADVRGTASAGKNVKFYLDGELAEEVQASKAGNYSATIVLPNPKNYKNYSLKIVSENQAGKELEVTKKITTIENGPKLKSAKLYIEGRPKYVDGVYVPNYDAYDLLGADNIKYISYNPTRAYYFEIKYENSKKINHVYVTSKRGGTAEKLEAKWDESKSAYITEGFFDNNSRYVPGELSISYTTKYEEPSYLDNDGKFVLSDYDKANMPEKWKDTSCQVVEDTDSKFEANITLGDGDVVNYKYDEISLSQLEQELGGVENENHTLRSESSSKLSKKKSSDLSSGLSELIDEQLTGGYHFEKYVTGEADFKNSIFYKKTDISADKIITYIYDPDKSNDPITKYVISKGKDFANETICDAIGVDAGVAGCVYDNFKSTANFGGNMANIAGSYIDTMTNPNLSPAQKNARCQQFKRAATIEVEKLAATYLANALTTAGIMLGPTGIGLALTVAGWAAKNILIPMIESGDFDDWMNGKISLSDLFIKWIIDPSGYIYDGVTSNRLSGVTTTVYYKSALSDEKATLWDASEYDQKNPLITDDLGAYAWDVPEGYWCVKAEKEGYETAYSDWLEVPPVQTNINIKLNRIAAPKVKKVYAYQTFAIVEFDQYMTPSGISNIQLQDAEGNIIEANVSYDTSEHDMSGNVYAKEYKLVYKNKILNAGSTLKTFFSDKIIGSNGKALKPVMKNSIVKDNISIESDDYLELAVGEEYNLDILTTGIKLSDIGVRLEGSSIVNVSPIQKGEKNDSFKITVKGLVYGDAKVTVFVNNSIIEKTIDISVGDRTCEPVKVDKPIATVELSEDFIPDKNIAVENDTENETTTNPTTSNQEVTTINNSGNTSKTNNGSKVNNSGKSSNVKKVYVKAPVLGKVKGGKKSLTVTWKKVKGINGYQIAYSLKSNFLKARTINVKSAKKNKFKIKKLKAKKKYYVRIRTYVKTGKVTSYSNWSNVKSKKTK